MAEQTTIEIPMTAADRRRVRRLIAAPDGVRFPLELPTGTILHPGQVLYQTEGRTYVVAAAPEEVVVVHPQTLAEAATIGHLIGNLHRDIETDGNAVVALADTALLDRLRRIGVPFSEERRAFHGRAPGAHAH